MFKKRPVTEVAQVARATFATSRFARRLRRPTR
jgi:hypothetical protein